MESSDLDSFTSELEEDKEDGETCRNTGTADNSSLCPQTPNHPVCVPVVASYDMEWAKRGRAMNSTSGVGAMIGLHSGKVMAYDTRKTRVMSVR